MLYDLSINRQFEEKCKGKVIFNFKCSTKAKMKWLFDLHSSPYDYTEVNIVGLSYKVSI